MSVVAAAERVLRDAGEPLHYGVITARMLDHGLWTTAATHPAASVNRQLGEHIRRHGAASPIARVGPGLYEVNDRVVPLPLPVDQASSQGAVAYLDAAQTVLTKHADRVPMHFVDITAKALSLGLLEAHGRPYEATLYAQVVGDISRADAAGQPSRFVKLGNGMVGLSRWHREVPDDDEARQTRKALLVSLFEMQPTEFELVVSQVLAEIGFDEIDVTAYHGDQGFDVNANLNAAAVFPMRVIVQVKRWKRTVGASEVKRIREVAMVDEHPIIVTTSGYTKAAFAEANRQGTIPVGLIAGTTLASLMMEHSVGVRRRRRDVFEPAPPTPQLSFDR